MRIKILTSLQQGVLQETSFFNLLEERWKDGNVTIVTDGYYDLLHVIGVSTPTVIRNLQQEKSKLIPIAYSPLGTIAPWSKASFPKTLGKYVAWHACGKHEYEYLQQQFTPTTITWLKNPVTTTDLTMAEFASAMQGFYQEVLDHHEEYVWHMIHQRMSQLHLQEEQHTLSQVLQQILYVEYKFKRKQILSSNIEELGRLMHETNYDEDELAKNLQLLKVHGFMASLEQVMEKRQLLSEGFMPIPPLQNRLTKNINKTIV